MSRIRAWSNNWIAVVVLLALGFVVSLPNALIALGFYVATALTCTMVVVHNVARRPLWSKPAWWSLAVALTAFTCAAWFGGLMAIAGRGLNAPNPLSLIVYAGLITSTALLVRDVRITRDTTTQLDSLIVMAAGGVVLLIVAIGPMLANDAVGASTAFAVTVVMILDLLLLSLAARLWLSPANSMNRGIRFVRAGLALVLIGSFSEHIAVARGAISLESPPLLAMQVLSLVAVTLVAIGASDRTAVDAPPISSDSTSHSRLRILVLLAVALIAPGLLAVVQNRTADGVVAFVVVLLMIGLGVAMAFRIGALVDDYVRALRREKALRVVGKDLAAAHSDTDIDGRIQEFVRLVAADPAATARITSEPAAKSTSGQVLPIPSEAPRFLHVTTKNDSDRQTLAALISMNQSVGLAFDRVDLAGQLVEQRSQDRLASLMQHSSDTILLLDDGAHVLYSSPAAVGLTGLPADDIAGQWWPGWFTDAAYAAHLLVRATEGTTVPADLTTKIDPSSPKRLDVVVTQLENDGHFVVTHHDVTSHHELQEELRRQAFHDPLTGLFNRALFRQHLARAMVRTQRQPGQVVVMMIDLDDFKTVNDSLGHPAGDELLQAVAGRLMTCLREADVAARLGGDEFAVILDGVWGDGDVDQVAERLLAKIREPLLIGSHELVTGASIGVAIADAGVQDAEDLERNADLALYQAKYAGKSCYRVFTSDLHSDAVRRLDLTGELRRALEYGELSVAYQPIVDLASGSLVGMEALARWHHPLRGDLAPNEFIPLAEENGLIGQLGRAMVEMALADTVQWHRKYPQHAGLRVAINLSGRQLRDNDAVDHIRDVLTTTGIDPTTVIFELTESVLLPDQGVTLEQLEALAGLGPHLYVDDFGTGYSSLQRLRALPVQGVKLAREFVTDLPRPDEMGLARAVHDLALTMGLEAVVAEGVERVEQREALMSLGYQLGQGFLMSRAVPHDDLDHMLATTPGCAWPLVGASALSNPL